MMRLIIKALALAVSASSLVHAQQPAWAQCGGTGWTGKTTCVSGYVCQAQNAYYSQCIPGIASSSSSKTSSSSSSTKTFTTSVNPSTTTVVTVSTTSSRTPTSTSTPPNPNPSSAAPKYLISFGDSYSQTGFFPLLSLPSPSNPLGNPSFPGYTTSGGPNWIGYSVTEFNTTPVYSYNFASGGATTDSKLVKPFADTVLSFVDQVDLYLKSAKDLPGFVKWDARNAVWAVWIGVNDVGNSWYLANYPTLLTSIMDQYINQTQTLHDLASARSFLFLTVPPIQYTPTVLASGAENVAAEGKAVAQYNEALTKRLEAFAKANAGVKVTIVDTTKPFMEAINDPKAYGAADATCFDASGTKCLWWNDYHPGMAIQRLVAKAVSVALGGW